MQTAAIATQSSRPEWFESWFDSEHYQRLYSHRDDREAGLFVDRLVGRLEINNAASILDLGCGTTKVWIAHGSTLVFAKTIQLGGRDLDAAVARAMDVDTATARARRAPRPA